MNRDELNELSAADQQIFSLTALADFIRASLAPRMIAVHDFKANVYRTKTSSFYQPPRYAAFTLSFSAKSVLLPESLTTPFSKT